MVTTKIQNESYLVLNPNFTKYFTKLNHKSTTSSKIAISNISLSKRNFTWSENMEHDANEIPKWLISFVLNSIF